MVLQHIRVEFLLANRVYVWNLKSLYFPINHFFELSKVAQTMLVRFTEGVALKLIRVELDLHIEVFWRYH